MGLPDAQTIAAIGGAIATVIGAVTALLAELRRWRRGDREDVRKPPV